MARTKIIIEIETEDEHFVFAASKVLIETVRTLVQKFSSRYAPSARPKVTITHDGKDVTEVIQ
jgi:hypothetical protein